MFLPRSKSIFPKAVFLTILVILFSLCLADTSLAASLSFSPPYSSVSVGNIVSVRILVNTDGRAINNVDGIIQFPADLLDVISISKNSSIFSLWVEEPKFSNYNGTITFNGGLPSPGYVGMNGEVVLITFRAKKRGIATITFTDSAVRQNDGLGTDVLTAKGSGTVEIKASVEIKVTPAPVIASTPNAPTVTSPTHPESSKWYSNSNPEFNWEVPSNVTAVATLIDKDSDTIPNVVSDKSIDGKKFIGLDDGIWYLHVRLRNKNGWGGTTHFKFQTDTVAPNPFKIIFPNSATTDNPRPIVSFNTTDNLSGIDHYEVKIGTGQSMKVSLQDVSTSLYSLPVQEPGLRSISVKALDRAGNEMVQNSEFIVLASKATPTPEIEAVKQAPSTEGFVLSWLIIFIVIVICLGLIILLIAYLIHRATRAGRNHQMEIDDHSVRRAFDFLRGKVSEQIRALKEIRLKRQLTYEEDRILKQLEDSLAISEESVEGQNINRSDIISK